MKRTSRPGNHSMCVQPMFLIGTYDENGKANFAPITWLSATSDGERYLIVVSMFGGKKTRKNVQRSGKMSANLVSVPMLPLADYLGSFSGNDGEKQGLSHAVSRGEKLDVPTLDQSPFVYELAVEKSVVTGESETFFCRPEHVSVDERVPFGEMGKGLDLTMLDPVIYSGDYHTLGKHLGTIGDYL